MAFPYAQVADELAGQVETLEAEVERLREALTAARDLFKRMEMPSYAAACDEALEA